MSERGGLNWSSGWLFSDVSATSSGSEGLGFLGRGGPMIVDFGDSDVEGSAAVLGGGGPMVVVMVSVSDGVRW